MAIIQSLDCHAQIAIIRDGVAANGRTVLEARATIA
jgi:hypothetical protein